MGGSHSAVVEQVSPLSFDATLDRLTRAIAQAGLTLFARIDHAAGAREAGLAMPPTVVLIYGHALGGTPIMLAAPQAALDLPLRVLVREDAPWSPFTRSRPCCWRPGFPKISRAGLSPPNVY